MNGAIIGSAILLSTVNGAGRLYIVGVHPTSPRCDKLCALFVQSLVLLLPGNRPFEFFIKCKTVRALAQSRQQLTRMDQGVTERYHELDGMLYLSLCGAVSVGKLHTVFIPHPIYVWLLVFPSKRPYEEKQTMGARAQSGRDTNSVPILQPTTTQMVEIEPMTTQMEGEGR